jgi:hypothetical protein
LRKRQAQEQQYQHAIEQLRGVTTARVMIDDQGEISEIHVISDRSRAPKRIVRDIETLLLARYAVRVDYRRVSLVQIEAADHEAEDRLQFISAQPDPADQSTVQVVLQARADRYAGSAPETAGEVGRAAADATIAAVQRAIGRALPLTVQRTQLVEGGEQPVCLAVIRADVDGGEERLTGTCLVTGSIWEAASKATLDAINRRLPVWTRQPGAGSQPGPQPAGDARRSET